MSKKKSLFVLTNENEVSDQIKQIGQARGYDVQSTKSVEEALLSLLDHTPSMIIIDQDLPNIHDIQRLTKLGIIQYCAPMLYLESHKSALLKNDLGQFESLNILGKIDKPIDPKRLEESLSKAENRVENIECDDLKKALKNQEFTLFYQPKVFLKTQQVGGAEVLIRWQHPELGIIGPGEFLPLAEKTDFIFELNEWIIETCFKQFATWQRANVDLQLNINLSGPILANSKLIEVIDHFRQLYLVKPSNISFEINENIAFASMYYPIFKQLRTMGFGLVIDDFGLNPISLEALSKSYFSSFKINKNYILKLGKDHHNDNIVKALVDLGHALNFSVGAVGLETADAWQLLTNLDCDYGQGYYISRPVSVAEFNKWLGIG